MNILETDQWCLLLPPEWQAEQEDGLVLITDVDQIGEITISTLCKAEGAISATEIAEMASTESPEITQWRAATVGAFNGVEGDFIEAQTAVREWYVAAGQVLLYITYDCEIDNRGMDDAAVDELLNTLVLGEV
jgi:hypothetical protein